MGALGSSNQGRCQDLSRSWAPGFLIVFVSVWFNVVLVLMQFLG